MPWIETLDITVENEMNTMHNKDDDFEREIILCVLKMLFSIFHSHRNLLLSSSFDFFQFSVRFFYFSVFWLSLFNCLAISKRKKQQKSLFKD